MLDQPTLLAFQQGLQILEQVHDFASMRETIARMISIVPPEDLHYARDAVARIMRNKQVLEAQTFSGNIQALHQIDQKYRDLYIVLRYAKPKIMQPRNLQPMIESSPIPSVINVPSEEIKIEKSKESSEKSKESLDKSKVPNNPKAKTLSEPPASSQPQPQPTPITQILPKNELQVASKNQLGIIPGNNNLPGMILNWIKTNKVTLFAGTAVAGTLGGAFWLYKHLTSEGEEKKSEETTFDKTIKSIQKYKAFSQLMKNPDMSNVEEFLSGKPITPKKKKIEKKEDKKPEKTTEWDTEERSLMKDMDSAFGALSHRPNIDFKLPQLPAPKAIDPKKIIGEADNEKKEKRRSLEKPAFTMVPISKKDKTPKKEIKSETKKEFRPLGEKSFERSEGRLVPIIKRTKKIKKITA